MTLEEAQSTLLVVNNAIGMLIAGKKLNKLEVGSGNFKRIYEYGEVTLESLREYRDELLSIIASYNNDAPKWRNSLTIPIIGRKGRR